MTGLDACANLMDCGSNIFGVRDMHASRILIGLLTLLGLASLALAEAVTLEKDDHICLIGNELGERLQHHNFWERLLHQRTSESLLSRRRGRPENPHQEFWFASQASDAQQGDRCSLLPGIQRIFRRRGRNRGLSN